MRPAGTVSAVPEDYRDHTAEDALIAYLVTPTPDQAHATELAIARLQRRYGYLLRRLDGDGDPPAVGVHRHNAWDDPEGCLEAVLHELAGALLEDRAETLAHGLEAVRALTNRADDARRYARLLYQQVTFGMLDYAALNIPSDDAEWPEWLTYYDGWHPRDRAPSTPESRTGSSDAQAATRHTEVGRSAMRSSPPFTGAAG